MRVCVVHLCGWVGVSVRFCEALHALLPSKMGGEGQAASVRLTIEDY